MLRPPDGGTRLELSSFVRPDHVPGSPAAMARPRCWRVDADAFEFVSQSVINHEVAQR